MTTTKIITRITVAQVVRELRNRGIIVSSTWFKLLHPTDFTNPIMCIRPIRKSGHSYGADNSTLIIPFLQRLAIPYSEGNDAPRRGKLGIFINVSLMDYCVAILRYTGLDLLKNDKEVRQAAEAAKSTVSADNARVEQIAGSIHPDDLFRKAIAIARTLAGEAKTVAYSSAFVSLLLRQPFFGDNLGADFWPVFRLVKKKALSMVTMDGDNTQFTAGTLYQICYRHRENGDFKGRYVGGSKVQSFTGVYNHYALFVDGAEEYYLPLNECRPDTMNVYAQ